MEPINFYRAEDEHGVFSNFAEYPIHLDGKTWPTTEHYFQAQKFPGTAHVEEIRQAKHPGQAARMGRDRRRPLRKDWERVKDGVMYQALYAKFTQYDALKRQLLETGDRPLVEHTEKDRYWGDGPDGRGKNQLGKLLIQLRGALLAEEKLK